MLKGDGQADVGGHICHEKRAWRRFEAIQSALRSLRCLTTPLILDIVLLLEE
jgi:hypothetical protein